MKIFKWLTSSLLIPAFVIVIFSVLIPSCRTERITILKDIPDTTMVRYFPSANYSTPVVKIDVIINMII